MIPYRLFVQLMQARRHVMAEERLQVAKAVGLAVARAMNGDDSKVKAAEQQELREAYPEEG